MGGGGGGRGAERRAKPIFFDLVSHQVSTTHYFWFKKKSIHYLGDGGMESELS